MNIRGILAHRYPPFEPLGAPAGRTALVVLATRDDPTRLREAVRVFSLASPQFVIASGGLRRPTAGTEPAARLLARTLLSAGVPASRLIVEDSSRTTRQQAQLIAALLRREAVDRVILVTADIHMPRAVGAFRAMGVEVAPAPAGGSTASLLHELIGLVYYVLRGWIR